MSRTTGSPEPAPSGKLADQIADATAPLVVADTLAKLVRKFGPERVVPEVERWLASARTGPSGPAQDIRGPDEVPSG